LYLTAAGRNGPAALGVNLDQELGLSLGDLKPELMTLALILGLRQFLAQHRQRLGQPDRPHPPRPSPQRTSWLTVTATAQNRTPNGGDAEDSSH